MPRGPVAGADRPRGPRTGRGGVMTRGAGAPLRRHLDAGDPDRLSGGWASDPHPPSGANFWGSYAELEGLLERDCLRRQEGKFFNIDRSSP
jgi:hypothetical protein